MKKLSFILIAICLLVTTAFLCGCNSFAWSDDEVVNSIDTIERIVDSEGNFFLEIRYTDTNRVDTIPLPEGNGIASVEHEDDEENRKTIVTITYTSGNVTVVEIPYGKDGEDGFSITEVVLDKTLAGDPVLVFYYTDENGTKLERGKVNIKELKGKDGLGFKSFEYFSDDIGSGVKIALTGESEPKSYYFYYKKNISVDFVGNDYIVTIGSSDPNGTPDIFRLTRMPTWLQGSDYPQSNLGIAGDFYFDKKHQTIYTKIGDNEYDLTSGDWVPVVELNTQINSTFKVTFNAGNGTISGYDQYKTGDTNANIYELKNIPYNSYFYDTYGSIPVPQQEGYKFLGWYRSLSPTVGEASFNDFVLITNNISLIARWEKIAE